MKQKAILLGVLSLFVAGQASAKIMDTWTRISIQFTNLARAQASDTGIGVTTLTTSAAGDHLNTMVWALRTSSAIPGLSINAVIPVTDPIVSQGGIVSVRLTRVALGIQNPITTTTIGPPPEDPCPLGCVRDQFGQCVWPGGKSGVLAPISGAVASTTSRPGFDLCGVGGGLGYVPSQGMVRICLLVPGCAGNLPLDLGATVNGVLKGGGVGGLLTIGGVGSIRISILGAPYTAKTVTVFNRTNNGAIQTFTEKGFAHGPLSNTSSTGQTSGVLQIVTPNHTSTSGVVGADISGQFSRMLVRFIPEPGMLLLLGSGAVGMALLGRKRIRK